MRQSNVCSTLKCLWKQNRALNPTRACWWQEVCGSGLAEFPRGELDFSVLHVLT